MPVSHKRSCLSPVMAAVIAALMSIASVWPLVAAELWMIEETGCPWCRLWNAEIGPVYPKTEEGREAPLRRLDLHSAMPAEVQLASPPIVTPTFILVANDRELGRIEGYPGEELFWWRLSALFEKLDTTGE